MTTQPDFTVESFRAQLGSDAQIRLQDGVVPVRLAEVTDLGGPGGDGPGRAPFSLLWQTLEEAPDLPQGTYPFHWGGPEVQLFIVPIGPGPDGAMRYESIFN